MKQVLRRIAMYAIRYLFRIVDPSALRRLAAEFGRRLSGFDTPTSADIVANYLHGFILFGRCNSYGGRFFWQHIPMRAVITKDTASVPKRLQLYQRRIGFQIKHDHDFEAIIHHCQDGRNTWLTPELIDIYRDAHKLGLVATVGTYRNGQLVGGLWGVAFGGTLGIMSMFHLEDHAGAAALAALTDIVANNGRWSVIDCGRMNSNWGRYGATEVALNEFTRLILSNSNKVDVQVISQEASLQSIGAKHPPQRVPQRSVPASVNH